MNRRWRAWCLNNAVLPFFLLANGNNTTDPLPSCHAPPLIPETTVLQRLLSWLEDHGTALLLLTVAIIASLGVYLAVKHRRWSDALDGQLEAGLISEEEHRRLGGRP